MTVEIEEQKITILDGKNWTLKRVIYLVEKPKSITFREVF